MLVVSVLLLTVWLGALLLDVPMGGYVHLLGLTAVLIVLARKSPRRAYVDRGRFRPLHHDPRGSH